MIHWLKKHRIGLLLPIISGLIVASAVYAITDIRFDLDTNEYVVNQNQRNTGNFSITGNMTLVGGLIANTNHLVIESATGRIGIGTATPSTRLDIDGQIRIRGGAPAAGRLLTAAADGTATWEPPAGGGFLPTGTASQTLRHSGTAWVATSNLLNDGTNVGLGITPTERLHVAGNILGTGWLRVADGTAAAPAFSFSADTDVGLFRPAADVLGVATAGLERLRVDATGNVGIGTAAPTHRLDVRGDVTAGAGADGSGIKLRMLDGVTVLRTFDPTDTGRANSINFGAVGAGGDLRAHGTDHHWLSNDGAINYMTIIGSTRNVGIGTTSPLERLNVLGNIRLGQAPVTLTTLSVGMTATDTTATVHSTAGYPSSGTLLIGSEAMTYTGTTGTSFTGVTRGALGTTATTHAIGATVRNYLFTALATATTPRMVVTGEGNVGIGTITPSVMFDVGGGVGVGGEVARFGGPVAIGRWGLERGRLSLVTGTGRSLTFNMDDATDATISNTFGRINITPSTNFIVTQGNVGIGTTAPGQRLTLGAGNILLPSGHGDIDGNLFFGGNTVTGAVGMRLFTVGGDGYIDARVSDVTRGLVFRVNTIDGGEERMRITGVGNVGIGTTNPTERLHVAGNILGTGWLRLADGTAAAPAVSFSADTDVGLFRPAADVLGVATAGLERLRVDATGNVGIGTAAPGAQLHLADIFTAGGKNLLVGDDVFLTDVDTLNTLGIYGNQDSTQGHIRLGSAGPTISGVAGNVGIGTTAPVERLDVRGLIMGGTHAATPARRVRLDLAGDPIHTAADFLFPTGGRFRALEGNIRGTNDIFFQAVPATAAGFGFLEAFGSAGMIVGTGGNAAPVIFQVDRVERARIDSVGNVGIGTTGPITRLDVAGTMRNVGGILALSLATPAAPTVTPQGASGTTTWRYRITARSTVGETLASAEGTTTTGNATLSATNFNRVTWTAVPGAVDYRIYRTTAGGTPSTTGLIGTATTPTFDDTGLAGSGTVPTVDTSGNVGLGTATPADRLDVIGNIRNIASPFAPPVRVGGIALTAGNDAANQVAVSGRYAYIVTGTAPARVLVVDISNPAAPVHVGGVTLATGNDNGSAIAVSGRHAFITLRTTPVRVVAIDISNPAAPTQVGSVTLNTGENEVWSIAVSGRHAYVVTRTSPTHVVAIDIANPTAPTRIGSVTLPTGEDWGWSLAVAGRYAYVVTDTTPPRVVAVDISNPAAPARVGAVTLTGSANGRFITVSGRHAYISTWASPSQIIAVDISNPAAPAHAGTITLASGENNILSMDVAGRYVRAVTLTSPARLVSVDFSNPAAPVHVGAVTLLAGEEWGRSVAVSGRHAYVVTESWPTRFVSIDISGIEATSAVVHSLEAGGLQVRESAMIQGNLSVASGIGVGSGGILSAGGVGIMGTTTGGIRRLHVGATVAGSHPIATAWEIHSDLAFKSNVREIPYGLREVLKLQPRAFNLNVDNSNSFGFIAQELKMVLPEVVSGEEGQMGVSYGLLTAVLTKAIQEQQAQIDELALSIGISREGTLTQDGAPMANQPPPATSFIERIRQALATLSGRVVEAGWWAFDRITVQTARIERIEMVDQATGRIFCTWVENGEWKKVDSTCAELGGSSVQTPQIPPAAPPPPTDAPQGDPIAPLPQDQAPPSDPPPTDDQGAPQDPPQDLTQPLSPGEPPPVSP